MSAASGVEAARASTPFSNLWSFFASASPFPLRSVSGLGSALFGTAPASFADAGFPSK